MMFQKNLSNKVHTSRQVIQIQLVPTYPLGLLEFVMIVRKIVLCNGIMLLQRHGKYIFSWPKLGQLRINNKA